MASRRKIDRFINDCPYLTEEYKKKLIEAYSDEKKLDDVVADWIREKIVEDIEEWYEEAYDKFVTVE